MNFIRQHINLFIKSPYLILFLFAVFAYWQIAFLTNSVQWDMLDCYLPWRHFVSDTIQNGDFPLWNPYQQLGYPIHADLRSVWNPMVLFVSLFGIYSNYTLHFFLILYLFLAGTGMYKLMLYFTNNRNISLLIAIAYILSGLFISHTQEISVYAGAAFIPFTLLYYLKFFDNYKFIDILKTAFFLFLMLSTVYPALTIILIYLLIFIFVFHYVAIIVRWQKKLFVKTIVYHFVLVLIMLALSSVFIVTIIQVAPYVSRISGLDIAKSQFGAFTPQSAISFLFPFASPKDAEFYKTDITMTNAYFGIVMLVLFISSLFKKHTRIEFLLLAFGFISLLASFGEYTPVRELMFRYVPLMDRFRFPSFFTIFSIIIFLIFTGNFLARIEKDNKYSYKPFIYISITLLIASITSIIYSISHINISDLTFFNSELEFWEKIKASTRFEHLFIHSIIQFVILSILVLYLLKRKYLKFRFLFWLVAIEMVISVQLSMYYTGIFEAKPHNIKTYVDSCPRGSVLPVDNPISENTDKASSYWPLWRNTCNFSKKVSFDSFNSFALAGYETVLDSFPILQENIIKNKLLYFSDVILPDSKLAYTEIKHNYVFVKDSIFTKYKDQSLKTNPADKIDIVKFTTNEIVANTKTKEQQIITLLQSNYYGWQVFIDGVLTPHFTSNYLTISTILPAGEHKIEYKYRNKEIMTAFHISYITFGILILILLISLAYKSKKYSKIYLIFVILLAIIIIYRIIYLSNKTSPVATIDNNLLFESNNDFEAEYDYWKTKAEKLSKTADENNTFYMVDSISEFCNVFESKYENIANAPFVDFNINVKVFLDSIANASLVLSVERDGKSVVWQSSPITSTKLSLNQWNVIDLKANNIEIQAGDIIKTYIWNKNKDQFLIDDFKIEITKVK